jgi:hypothetical protein
MEDEKERTFNLTDLELKLISIYWALCAAIFYFDPAFLKDIIVENFCIDREK